MEHKLRELGLSPYETKCYLALIKFGKLLGKDIAKESGVPPTSVYRNMESLLKKGLVQTIQKEPLVYQAVDPEIAITSYLQSQRERRDKTGKEVIKDLKSLHKKLDLDKSEEVLEVYAGREQSYTLGKKLIDKTEKECLMIGRGSKQSILDLIHHLNSAAKRGILCKLIITTKEENKGLILELQKVGVKIKYLPLKGFSMLVRDREASQIVIKSESLKEERVVLKISNKDLSQAHADYFDTVWKRATPV